MKLDAFDSWLSGEKEQALLGQQELEPVQGKDGIVSPPTYPPPEDQKDKGGTFLINRIKGKNECDLDSIPSQANRIEPLFGNPPFDDLIPQIVITNGEERFNALTFAHRIAEGALYFSGAIGVINAALQSAKRGDCVPLAKLSPTSILFGFWNSQFKKREGVNLKVARAFWSTITAHDVEVVNRNSVYISVVPEIVGWRRLEELGVEEGVKDSELGAANAIGKEKPYGVVCHGGIFRKWYLGLPQLRSLNAATPKETLALRRYVLSLGLLSFSFDQPTVLRSGCHLLPVGDASLKLRSYRSSSGFSVCPEEALDYAKVAADAFGVGEDREFEFSEASLDAARKAAKKEKEKGAK